MDEDESEMQVPCPWCDEYFQASAQGWEGTIEKTEPCPSCQRPVKLTVSREQGETVAVDAERG